VTSISHLSDISTPAALIDEVRMLRNITRMQQRMTALGVRFRPHVKTTKCIEIASRQRSAGASTIAVSTLKEAEQFCMAGFTDVLYAVCITPAKLDRALTLCRRGCRLTLLVDSMACAHAIVAKGREEKYDFEVMIEIDSDGHRSGIQADDPTLIEIGRMLQHRGGSLKGVLTHAGSSYALDTPDALRQLADQERAECIRAADKLRSAGLSCPEVSVGSTPTALSAATFEGVTEVRAGVYVLFDLVMANVGVCTREEIALSVLATVIGHQVDKGWVIVDAGWRAMSRDRGTQRQKVDYGYGAICDEDGNLIEGFVLTGVSQEHGIASRRDGKLDSNVARRFPIGARLRILPNHACATSAQFSEYQVLTAHSGVQTWRRFDGW
jgi:Predicted amino acid aldolase or racemase